MAKKTTVGYVIFYVDDVRATLDHWCDAYGCTEKFMHDSGQYGELDTGATTIGFAGDGLMAQNGVKYRPNRGKDLPIGAQVSFVTRDPSGLMSAATKRGAVVVKKLEEKPWGQTSGLLRDPNGILVEVCTPIEHR